MAAVDGEAGEHREARLHARPPGQDRVGRHRSAVGAPAADGEVADLDAVFEDADLRAEVEAGCDAFLDGAPRPRQVFILARAAHHVVHRRIDATGEGVEGSHRE